MLVCGAGLEFGDLRDVLPRTTERAVLIFLGRVEFVAISHALIGKEVHIHGNHWCVAHKGVNLSRAVNVFKIIFCVEKQGKRIRKKIVKER